MWIISWFCLVFVGVMCVVATLSPTYKDNLVQRVSMMLICIGVLAKAKDILVAGTVPGDLFLAHLGLAGFALGTWRKVWVMEFEARARHALWGDTLPQIDVSQMRQIRGRGTDA